MGELRKHSSAITAYVCEVAHLFSASESKEILEICSTSGVPIHSRGVYWLLQKATSGHAAHPVIVAAAFVAAASLARQADSPFIVEIPDVLRSFSGVAKLSPSDIFPVALVAAQGVPEDDCASLFKRLAFYIERGDFSNSQLEQMLSLSMPGFVHDACFQSIHSRLSALTQSECVSFLDLAVDLSRPGAVTVSALLQVTERIDLRGAHPEVILRYYFSLSKMVSQDRFAWIRSQSAAEVTRVQSTIDNDALCVLEDISVEDFCRLVAIFVPCTQSAFDAFQLRAFVLADSMSCAELSSSMAFISDHVGRDFLVAYPAVNRLKKTFFERHRRDVVACRVGSNLASLVEAMLLTFLQFVRSISRFPLMPVDSAAIATIQDVWRGTGDVSLLMHCSESTKMAITDELARLQQCTQKLSLPL